MPTEPQIHAFVNCIVDYIIDRGASAAAEPPGHTLAGHPEDLGLLPVDRPGQRVAAAPALALPQHHGGPAGPAGGSGGRPHSLPDLDRLLGHKRAFFSFPRDRWETLFEAHFDVPLYDLTSRRLVFDRFEFSGNPRRRQY